MALQHDDGVCVPALCLQLILGKHSSRGVVLIMTWPGHTVVQLLHSGVVFRHLWQCVVGRNEFGTAAQLQCCSS